MHSLPQLFDKALKLGGNTHTRQDILDGIKAGKFLYFGDDRCALVVEPMYYPRCKKLHLFIAAGDLDWLLYKYLPIVKQYAVENGFCALTSVSRKGFLRRFPKEFKPKFITFELAIDGNTEI